MNRRIEFQKVLEDILGSKEVYFQKPTNISMKYPAILYDLDDIPIEYADNKPYILKHRYQVIFITKDPDSEIIDKLLSLSMSEYDRNYKMNNLYHHVYRIYY